MTRIQWVYFAMLAIIGPVALAADPNAHISVQCTGKKGAQVALRWGSPHYDSNPTQYMDMFTVPCVLQGQPMIPNNHPPVAVQNPNSQFEVQTEGGVETSYVVTVAIDSQQAGKNNFIILDHTGSPSTMFTGKGFTLKQSSGPNKYGEQNMRVDLTSGNSARVHLVAQSVGDRSNAQVAVRWGHPDFNDHGLIGIFTAKAGPARSIDFTVPAQKSELEIQTEGGEGTGYNISIWIDSNPPSPPSIEITYQKPNTDVTTGTTDMTFDETKGNIYGEMNVNVYAPWIVSAPPAAPPPSGWEGGVTVCNASGPATLHLEAHLVTPLAANASGATTMSGAGAENDPITFTPRGSVSTATFKTKQNFYKEGTWQITAAQVVGVTGKLPNPPLTQLPGALGNPVLDFTGGTCTIN